MIFSRSWRRSHCDGEPVGQRARARVGEHALDLLLETACVRRPPVLAARSSSASGTVPHRKNDSREATSVSDTR